MTAPAHAAEQPTPIADEEYTAEVSPRMEAVTAALVMLLGATGLVLARGITLRNETGGIDPRWWPTVICAGIIVCGIWMLVNAARHTAIERTVEPSRTGGWLRVLITVGALVVVLVAWQLGVSFLPLAPAFLIITNWLYGLRRWTTLLLFPAIITAILFAVFQLLLKVPL